MSIVTVTTEQVRELIQQLAAQTSAASITPEMVANIFENMRQLNDQERAKVIATAEAYIAEIENTGIPAEKVLLDEGTGMKVDNAQDAIAELAENSLELLGGERTKSISLGNYYDNQYYNEYGRLISYGSDPKPIAYYPVNVSELLGKELTIKITWSNYTESSWCNLICFRANSDVNTPLSTTNGIIKESTAYASAVNNVATLNVEVTNNYLLIATRDRNATFKISYQEVKKGKIAEIDDAIEEFDEMLESSLIISKNYVLSDFTTSAYYNLTGSTAPTEVTSSMAIFVCLVTPVKAGQKIILKSRGSTNGRAYALTDNQRNILAVAPENADYRNGLELQVAQNGYLYVNDVTSYFATPSISIKGNNIEILEEEMESMQNEINSMHESVEDVGAAKIFNPRIDFQKNGLKILDIGNSYTVDSTHYLPNLIQSANIDTQYSLYRLIRSGSSFKNWVDVYNDMDDRTYDSTFIAGNQSQDIPTGTGSAGDGTLMKNVLNVKWDVIIIHQLSTYAPYYKEWEGHTDGGYLKEFIRILKIHCPQAQIGFLLVHSYPSTTSGNVEHDSNLRWAKIAKSAKWIMNNYGMNFVIPYGTGVQNLRQCSEFFNNNELSTDGNHMADGLGDYVAACCYFQQLFGAMRGVSVLGNTYRVSVDETVTGQVSVTDETALLAQKAAILACTDMFALNNPSEVTL